MTVEKNKGAWVWFRWSKDAPRNAWNEWKNFSDWSVWSTTGDWDGKIWVDCPESALEDFVWDEVRKNKWVVQTKTELSWQINTKR